MDFNKQDIALVITDPQNDFLSPDGVTWGLVGASVEENGTVGHIDDLFRAAKEKDYGVFISPPITTSRPIRVGSLVERSKR